MYLLSKMHAVRDKDEKSVKNVFGVNWASVSACWNGKKIYFDTIKYCTKITLWPFNAVQ